MHYIMKIAMCLALATIIEASVIGNPPFINDMIDCLRKCSEEMINLVRDHYNNLNACSEKAESERYNLDKSIVDDRTKIERKFIESLAAFVVCMKNENHLQYFNCMDEASKNNTNIMNDISINAKDVIARMNAKSIEIERNEEQCRTNAERGFKDESDKIDFKCRKCSS